MRLNGPVHGGAEGVRSDEGGMMSAGLLRPARFDGLRAGYENGRQFIGFFQQLGEQLGFDDAGIAPDSQMRSPRVPRRLTSGLRPFPECNPLRTLRPSDGIGRVSQRKHPARRHG